jgi:diguanylate cyclase (GGDEF)-like protein
MKLLARLSSGFSGDWSDWRRRDKKDAVVILGILALTYVVGTAYDWAIKLFRFAADHENWYIDDLLFMAFVLGLAMIVYGFCRYKDISREINARITAESEARNLARHDPLTGLPNRRFFTEKLDECLSYVNETHRAAVLMLDLDGFKLINDTHGHAVGDEALREFAHRVSTILRGDNILARIGGDEFAIIMPKIDSLDDPTNLARRIGSAIVEPFVIGNVTAELGVGIGIAIAPDNVLTSWSGEQIARFIVPRLLADHPFASLRPRWTRMSSGASSSSVISEVR